MFLALLIGLGTHYLFGGIRLAPSKDHVIEVSRPARIQLAVLAGTFIALKAASYWLDRYSLLWSGRKEPTFTGAGYTDINAVLPARLIMVAIAVLCAVAFFAAIAVRDLRIPAMATALLVLSSILVGGIYPALIEQFSVRPNAADRERAYIERNIAATRQAYGIGLGPGRLPRLSRGGHPVARATFPPTSPRSPTPACWTRPCSRAPSPSSNS